MTDLSIYFINYLSNLQDIQMAKDLENSGRLMKPAEALARALQALENEYTAHLSEGLPADAFQINLAVYKNTLLSILAEEEVDAETVSVWQEFLRKVSINSLAELSGSQEVQTKVKEAFIYIRDSVFASEAFKQSVLTAEKSEDSDIVEFGQWLMVPASQDKNQFCLLSKEAPHEYLEKIKNPEGGDFIINSVGKIREDGYVPIQVRDENGNQFNRLLGPEGQIVQVATSDATESRSVTNLSDIQLGEKVYRLAHFDDPAAMALLKQGLEMAQVPSDGKIIYVVENNHHFGLPNAYEGLLAVKTKNGKGKLEDAVVNLDDNCNYVSVGSNSFLKSINHQYSSDGYLVASDDLQNTYTLRREPDGDWKELLAFREQGIQFLRKSSSFLDVIYKNKRFLVSSSGHDVYPDGPWDRPLSRIDEGKKPTKSMASRRLERILSRYEF